MAILIPAIRPDTTRSERLMFERLGRELDDDWIVLHSLGLSRLPGKVWGEADFVIVSTKGVFAIEVKGGQVSCKDGQWTVTSLDGKSTYSKSQGPFVQAKDAMFELGRILGAGGGFRDLLIGYGVVMPFERFTATGPEIEPAVLLDKREFGRNLGFYVGRLSSFWQQVYRERHERERRLPGKAELPRIRQILRPDIESALSLGSYLNNVESERIGLTNQQIRVARGVHNNARTIIRGKAGTGKTILAVDRVKTLAKEGRHTHYLCFNRLLSRHVELNLAAEVAAGQVTVRHVHSWYYDLIERADLKGRLAESDSAGADFFATVMPALAAEALLTLNEPLAETVVVDEGQDILTPSHLETLDLLIDGGLRQGHWSVFLDPNQNIYGQLADEAESWLGEAGFASYELSINCRNTRPVAVQGSIVSGIDLCLEGAIDGPPCEPVFYNDDAGFVAQFSREVERLIASDVSPRDLVVLSGRKLENSLLRDVKAVAGLPLVNLNDGEKDAREGIDFCTMHAFKGLERRVVLAIELDGMGTPERSMLHYAGLSRASGLLIVFLRQSDRATYESQAGAFGRRLAGGL